MRFRDRALVPLAVAIAGAAVAALLIFSFGPTWWPPMVRVVAVYDASAIAMLVFDWVVIIRSDAAATRARAAIEDPGRNVVFAIVLIAIGFGFLAAFYVLLPAPKGTTPHQAALVYALGLAAVVLGWLLIHTLFVFRYGHLYYQRFTRSGNNDGGLMFPGTREPRSLDFAYFSFVLGMTFQVSDVQVTDQRIRALALAHGLVSFGYNTAILALVVNTVAGLLH